MRMSAVSRLVAAVVLVLVGVGKVEAKDLFVKAGSDGDGTKAKPFGDPFEALATCEAGDVIHIAEGRYTGKLGSGEWEIPFENISLMGGYSGDFSERDPWKHPTMLVWDHNSKNSPKDERIIARQRGAVLDGLVLNGEEQNKYVDEHGTGRDPRDLDKSTAMVRMWLPSTVRNCVFVNTGREAVVCPNGTTIENNLFVNTFDTALRIQGLPPASPEAKTPAIVKNNTFLWAWDDRAPGAGRYSGTAIALTGPATITNNIIAFCDNNGIYMTIAPDRTTVSNNVFFMNQFSNLKAGVGGKDVVVDDKTMDLFEEVGFKAAEGNTVANPGVALDPAWLNGTTKRTPAEQGKVKMDDWNKFRQAMGMDLVGEAGKDASGIAPRYPAEKVVALMEPKSSKAGARMVKLETKFGGGAVAGGNDAPAKNYQKIELAALSANPESFDGKAVEVVVAPSGTGNVGGIPSQFKESDYQATKLYDAGGEGRVTGFYKKGTSPQRVIEPAAMAYGGSGKPSVMYRVQGTAYVIKNIPKAGIQIDSIAPLGAGTVARSRAAGRDWFVKAGTSGGDGTKDKPFRDPYQALEKVEKGDTIHVAGGEYVGKLRAGTWTVAMPDIAMLGGYDDGFTERDPWKHPTLLYCPADFKGTRGGYTLQGDGDHSGFILDGFVFDKKLNNVYDSEGDLNVGESDKTEHLWLARPGCEIRNCVFMNGAGPAIRMTASQTLQNCIIFNHYGAGVRVEKGFTPEVPAIIRNNTFAFTWEIRFGQGHGIMADLLILEGDVAAVIDNNVFEFADQHAIRLSADPKNVELTNNVFGHNLFAEVFRTTDQLFVDNKNWDQLKQLGWKKLEGNKLGTAALPLDQKWFDVYLKRTAYTPGKVEMDDWNQFREMIGQPMIATGGSAGHGRAPAYDRAKAMELFPKNSQVKAGAHPVKLEVKFTGVAKAPEAAKDYQEITWDTARNSSEWEKLQGKRVSFKGAIQREDNQYPLSDLKKEDYAVFMVGGPEGSNSPGLPMRVYVQKGTKAERMFRDAKGYSSGTPDETHVVKGVAREGRQMVIEAVEKAD
jgi:parallel beta-helix repeat protein